MNKIDKNNLIDLLLTFRNDNIHIIEIEQCVFNKMKSSEDEEIIISSLDYFAEIHVMFSHATLKSLDEYCISNLSLDVSVSLFSSLFKCLLSKNIYGVINYLINNQKQL
jgi:hypothetical protein